MIEFKTAKKDIIIKSKDGEDISINIDSTLFLGRESIAIALQLGKIIAPFFKALGGISSKFDPATIKISENVDEEVNKTKVREAILKNLELTPDFFKTIVDQLISSMDEKRVMDLIFRLLKGTRINNQEVGKPEIFDVIFQANIGLLLKVLQFILEENFSSFFGVSGIDLLMKIAMGSALTK
jgi:hypothetical protein